jgi:hypothetical protein
MKLVMLVLLIFLLSYNYTWAFDDGNTLLEDCSLVLNFKGLNEGDFNTNMYIKTASCAGFMQGITQTIRLFRILNLKTLSCIPKNGIRNYQAARIVVNYLKKHPEKLHSDGVLLAHLAFMDAFPCQK